MATILNVKHVKTKNNALGENYEEKYLEVVLVKYRGELENEITFTTQRS